MKVTEVHIYPITPQHGLVAFAHVVINGCLLLGSIAIHEKRKGGWRITFPQKGNGYVFHPITRTFSQTLEDSILDKVKTVFEKHHAGQHHIEPATVRI